MAILVENNRGFESSQYKEIQLTCTSANTNAEILAEIAAYEAVSVCAIGSKAYSFNYDVYYKKKNDGNWASIL